MPHSVQVELCGRIRVVLDGRRVEDRLPARQGRLLFAFLVLNRHRRVSRDQLVDALWSGERPPNAQACLSSVLSRLRRMLGPGVLEGRGALSVTLPADAWVDVEAAADALDRASTAAGAEQWMTTATEARSAIEIFERGFLPGDTGLWIDDQRARIDELLLHARQYVALAALAGGELVSAERAARALVAAAPFREEGYRLLMEAHAAAGTWRRRCSCTN